MGVLTCLIGIVCTSVAAQFYPEEGLLWSPYDLLTAIQMHGGNGARAAVFFACKWLWLILLAHDYELPAYAEHSALAFLVSQFGINIAGNAISGGIDLASLFPKYIDIRRGAIITTVMALPMCPWALLSGATVYISVMSGYATFLGPMTGLMVFDYVLVRKQKMKLSALVSDSDASPRGHWCGQYDGSPDSVYWYWRGVNWRAPVAWVFGVAPLFPGFLQSVSTVSVPLGAIHVYYLCFPRRSSPGERVIDHIHPPANSSADTPS
jgi:NCS1 family nucleobase:cation symporter-1